MTDEFERRLGGQRVLVTGGAGVIGVELLSRLSALGAETLSVDRLPLAALPARVEHIVANLAFEDLGPIARFRPRQVFHLAATFERSVETAAFWEQNWNDNVVVTHRIAELAARLGGIESLVFASSYLVYDPAQYFAASPVSRPFVLTEASPLRPRNLCGAAKFYGEAEIEFMREVRGAAYRPIHARIFRVYGRRSRDVVSRWVRAALRGEEIEVYHPENRFDYVFSADVAEGLVRMAAAQEAVGPINLASGQDRSVAEVIAAIEHATGAPVRRRSRSVNEPYEASCADLGRLRATLGWTPPTSLETGVALLVDHERQRLRDDERVSVGT